MTQGYIEHPEIHTVDINKTAGLKEAYEKMDPLSAEGLEEFLLQVSKSLSNTGATIFVWEKEKTA
ncbi:MAG: hypothetical protein M1484_01455 [Patescibacteria group bacterium]|nr:hypothetical protein [Patescibacteria group bacterium]MCL5431748.1 hypothetical protein [Patescibacteria group bacterium]